MVLFPPDGVAIEVEDVGGGVVTGTPVEPLDVGGKVDVGIADVSVEFVVGKGIELVLSGIDMIAELELGVGVISGVLDDSVEFAVGTGIRLVISGSDIMAELELGVGVTSGVADDSVEFAVGSGMRLVISGIDMIAELELGVGVGVGVTSEEADAEDLVSVVFEVSFEVDSLVEEADIVPFDVGDPGSKVSIMLVNPSNKPRLLELGVGVDVVVTTPVGKIRIPEEEDVGVASLETSAEAEDEIDDVAFEADGVDESETAEEGVVGEGSLVGVASSLTDEDSFEDDSTSLEVDPVVGVVCFVEVAVVVVLEEVAFPDKDAVGDGGTYTVDGITIVTVPSSLLEDVSLPASSPRPMLLSMSDIEFLLVDDVEEWDKLVLVL